MMIAEMRLLSFILLTVAVRAGESSEPLRLVAQTGFAGAATAVAISPDGRLALTGEFGMARLWHVETGRLIRMLAGSGRGAGKEVIAARFSANGTTAYTIDSGGAIRAWDVVAGSEKWWRYATTAELSSASISTDGRYAVLVPKAGPVQVWNLTAGSLWSSQQVDGVTLAAISKSGKLGLAAGNMVYFSGTRILTLVHPAPVVAIDISADDRWLATAAIDHAVRIWNLQTGQLEHELHGHKLILNGVAFSPDGRLLFSGGDREVMWDVQTGRQIRADDNPSFGRYDFTADGRTVIAGGMVRTDVRDVPSGKLQSVLEGKTIAVNEGGFLPDGRILLLSLDRRGGVVLSSGAGIGAAPRIVGSGCLQSFALYPKLGLALGCRTSRETNQTWAQLARLSDGGLVGEFGPLPGYIQSAQLSADGSAVALLAGDGTFAVWDAKTGQERFRLETLRRYYVKGVSLSPDGHFAIVTTYASAREPQPKHIRIDLETRQIEVSSDARSVTILPSGEVVKGAFDGVVTIYDARGGSEVRRVQTALAGLSSLDASPDGRRIVAGSTSGDGALIDSESGKMVASLKGHWNSLIRVAFSAGGERFLTTSYDHQVRIWDSASGRAMATLIFQTDGGWAVLDDDGRYDASSPKGLSGVHWVLGNEPIELGQLKNRFWTPGLLSKVLKGERLPEVPEAFHRMDLYPAVKLQAPTAGSRSLKIELANQGGGIGRVVVKVNGRELPQLPQAAARGGDGGSASLQVDLGQAILSPDGNNRIEVAAYDARGLVVSRPARANWATAASGDAGRPQFYALVAGASRYGGSNAMNLLYPSKDASDMARALALGAGELFGADHIHITLLTSGGDAGHLPTKANFRRGFADIASQAKAADTVLLYLAGHGVAKGKDSYYFLTADARSLELDDAALADVSTVSSVELRKWLQLDVKALKCLVILDTCAAGAANADFIRLGEKRELSGDQMRAIELLNDSAGSFILMGSAADKVSYEANRYGQGLLTYALLAGMKGEVQLDGGQLDVLRWFTYAQGKVEALAKGIGGIQQPLLSSPIGRSFPVALLPAAVKEEIPLAAPKAQVLRALCLSQTMSDPLGLGPLLRERLRDLSDPVARGGREGGKGEASMVYLDAVPDGLPGAISPRATYRRTGSGVVEVKLILVRDGDEKELAVRNVTGLESDKAGLVGKIAASIVEALRDLGAVEPDSRQ